MKNNADKKNENEKPNRIHKIKIDYENILKVSKMNEFVLSLSKSKERNQLVLLAFNYNGKTEKHYTFPFYPEEFYTLIVSVNSGDLLVRRRDENGNFLNFKEDTDKVRNKMSELVEYSGYKTLNDWINSSYFGLSKYMYRCNVFNIKSKYTEGNLVHNKIKINKEDASENKIIAEFDCDEYDVVNESMKKIKRYLSTLD